MKHEDHKEGIRKMLASGKGKQKQVSDWIAKLTREKKAGTGPHSGKGGPLVKDPRQIAAIAYSKVRRGEG